MSGSNSNLGTSAQSVSDGHHSLQQEEVKPGLASDLRKHQTCFIDVLLRVFLARCRREPPPPATPQSPATSPSNSSAPPSPPSPSVTEKATVAPTKPKTTSATPASASETDGSIMEDERLLSDCLKQARKICDSGEMRRLLTEYCKKSGQEAERYEPFAEAFNYALERLHSLKLPELRDAPLGKIYFHVNAPKTIEARHEDKKTTRIPGINLVTLEAAKLVNPVHRDGQDIDFWRNICLSRPQVSFLWPQVLSPFEFKKGTTKELSRPPAEYPTVSPHPVPSLKFGSIPDPPIATDGTSSSAPTTSSASADPSTNSDASNSVPQVDAPRKRAKVLTTATRPRTRSATHQPTASTPRVEMQPPPERRKPRNATQNPEKTTGEKINEAIIQCGSYGAEMLYSSIGRHHAIGVLVIDQTAWVWWYDRQGAIQSEGIDFVNDTPRFLALLLAFQRFTEADWGYNSGLDPENLPPVDRERNQSCSFRTTNDREFSPVKTLSYADRWALAGRCTWVIGATCTSADPDTLQSLAKTSLVMKAYWPNEKRVSEETIIKCAGEVPGAEEHLPRAFGSHDGYRTATIRAALGIFDSATQPFRVFRIVVLERLYPITELHGPDFINAWRTLIYWHFLIWDSGVQHRDLSVSNLMLRKTKDKTVPVLNDWDLGFIANQSQDVGEHTATMPYLASDLLTQGYWEGKVTVLYRHDLESFGWILLWVFVSFSAGKEDVPNELKQWQTADYVYCRANRTNYLGTLPSLAVPQAWTTEWPIMKGIRQWMYDRTFMADTDEDVQPGSSNLDVYRTFTALVQQASKHPGLQYLNTPVS